LEAVVYDKEYRELPIKVNQVRAQYKNGKSNFDHYISRGSRVRKVHNNIFPRDEIEPMESYRKNKNPLMTPKKNCRERHAKEMEVAKLLNELRKGVKNTTKPKYSNAPRATTPLNSNIPKYRPIKNYHKDSSKGNSFLKSIGSKQVMGKVMDSAKVLVKRKSRRG